MSCLAFPFFFVCVCVCVRCVIIPVRNFKTSHHPHYPLPCEFRHNAQSKISNLNHTLFQFFKVFDSAVKVVLYFIFSNVTVPAVWFPFTTSTSSTPSLDMAHSSVVVTFPCKEIKILITTIAAKCHVTFRAKT